MVEASEPTSDDLRRGVVLYAIGVVAVWVPLVGWLRYATEPFVVPAYSVLTIAFVGLFLALLTDRLSVSVVELAAVATAAAVMLVRLATVVTIVEVSTLQLRRLVVEMTGPTLVVCVLVLFLALDLRIARDLAVTIWVAFAIMLTPDIVRLLLDGDRSAAGALGGQVVLLTLVSGLAHGLASVRSQLAVEHTRAEALVELANTDPLTGVYNRRGASEVLAHQLATVSRYGGELSIALLDIDRFKARNDHHGHAAGDEALVAIVRTLSDELRSSDVLGRWGGDELLVVVPGTPPDQVHLMAQRWRQLVADLKLAAGDHILTVSIGVATYRPGDDIDRMLHRADRSLYAVKDAGGDAVATDVEVSR